MFILHPFKTVMRLRRWHERRASRRRLEKLLIQIEMPSSPARGEAAARKLSKLVVSDAAVRERYLEYCRLERDLRMLGMSRGFPS